VQRICEGGPNLFSEATQAGEGWRCFHQVFWVFHAEILAVVVVLGLACITLDWIMCTVASTITTWTKNGHGHAPHFPLTWHCQDFKPNINLENVILKKVVKVWQIHFDLNFNSHVSTFIWDQKQAQVTQCSMIP
jgi:hypothetical protein